MAFDPPCSDSKALSARRVHGVHKHVLANGSALFNSHPNHANIFRLELPDSGIPRTKEIRAKMDPLGAFEPNTFTCASFFLYLAHVNVFGKEYRTCVQRLPQELLDKRTRHGSPLGSRDARSVHLHSGTRAAWGLRGADVSPTLR